MSLSLGKDVVGECVELVDELRIQDIQVTGLSVPILVRTDAKRSFDHREFVDNNLSCYSLKNLVQYTESLCKDLPINLTSVLFQHNANPLLGYSSDLRSTRIKKGGEIESEICSRLAAIFSQVCAPNIVKQLSWFYLFDHKLEYLLPDWNKVPLVQYILYTITEIEEQINHPVCEPSTKWIFCLRGKIVIQLLPPTPVNVAAFRKFLYEDEECALSDLFQTDSIETHLYRNQALFIPGGWIYLARREAQTIEYGGEFFHSFSIEHQFGVWHLYKETYLSEPDQAPPPFFTCHWLVLQAYLSSFQDVMLTAQEAMFDLERSRSLLPHFSPFECRGMLFLIELIRSGRLPMLRQCIPSSVTCAVSLLQKMQTILLHETIFSAFSCLTPNGIMFFGTPKDGTNYVYKSKGRDKQSKTKHSSLPNASLTNRTLPIPAGPALSLNLPATTTTTTNETQDNSAPHETQQLIYENSPTNKSNSNCLNISIQLTGLDVSPEEAQDDSTHRAHPSETSSSTSNYQSLVSDLSKSPSPRNTPSIHSENSDITLLDISFPNDREQSHSIPFLEKPVPTGTNIREFLTTHLSQSVLSFCGFCQFCKYQRRGNSKMRVCILQRIADRTLTPINLVYAPQILIRLVQYLSVYPPISHNNPFINEILNKTMDLFCSPPSPVKEASLSDIQNILIMVKTHDREDIIAMPANHSTPLGSPSK